MKEAFIIGDLRI